MNFSFTLCPESIARLPAKGRSAFVRAAIIKFSSPASTSKGLPAVVEPVLISPAPVDAEPVAVAPVVVEPAEPVTWQRSWSKPPREFPDGFDYTSLVWDKARKIFLNPPPWPAVPSLDMEQARSWYEYAAKWIYPDPFPGPLEWHAMGEPSEPLPEHRATVEPVEPLPVEPLPAAGVSQESPPAAAVPAPSQESPFPATVLPVAGMSPSNILEEV